MPKPTRQKNDTSLGVPLYRGHFEPRGFRIPYAWFDRLSWGVWLVSALVLISLSFGVRGFRLSQRSDPARVRDLEGKIAELEAQVELAASKPTSDTPTTASGDPKASDTAPAAPASPVTGESVFWKGLAAGIDAAEANRAEKAKIALQDIGLNWNQDHIRITGNLIFTEPGKGNQQGRIVILARSKTNLAAHPEGVLSTPQQEGLFDPNRGEYFSVGRFRAVQASLGPFPKPSDVQSVEILIFDLHQKLLIYKSYPTPDGSRTSEVPTTPPPSEGNGP